MDKREDINTAGIAGTVAIAPEPYENLYGYKNIYALWLDTARNNGVIDRILVLFQEEKIDGNSFKELSEEYEEAGNLKELIKEGSKIEVTGAIQIHKDKSTKRTQLFVWAKYLAALPEESPELNIAYINGEIVRTPVYRKTPLGRRITEIVLRVPSVFAPDFYSNIPCITWGKTADYTATMREGDTVYLEGRIQTRTYEKRTEEGEAILTTWEVSVRKLEPCNYAGKKQW